MRRLLWVAVLMIGCAYIASSAQAQTWSRGRQRPPLWQIISVDPSGLSGWPYGQEDPAGDGVATLEADEAGIDLRTVYADADGNRLWVRAYVTSQSPPPATAVAFFFIDTDANSTTGGDANDTDIFRTFTLDPTAGGYEHAIGVDGRGMLIDSFVYNAAMGAWRSDMPRPGELGVEVDADRDPIGPASVDRGYFQIDLAHSVTGLNSSCEANIFVRLHNDDAPDRDFGDDDDEGYAACRPRLNDLGDPVVLRTDACQRDADCPADGRCDRGVCLFDYTCGGDTDCQSGEACRNGRCVVVVDRSCTDDADCDGLVCESGQCVACSETGGATCGENQVCSSVGRCVDPAAVASGDGDMSPVDGEVRGGAFSCAAATPVGARHGTWLVALLALALGRRGWRGRRWRERRWRRTEARPAGSEGGPR